MKRFLGLLAILASFGARAEVPGGHFYLGVGGQLYGSHVGSGAGLSLEAQLEFSHFFLGATYGIGGVSRSGMPDQGLFYGGLRAGWFFTEDPLWTPFTSLGFGGFSEGQVIFDDAAGAYAFVPEAGVALFRGNRFGRLTLSLQGYILTSHDVSNQKPQYNRLDNWVGLSLRAML